MAGVRKCRFFRWKDAELLDPYYKGVIFNMKKEIENLESGTEIHNCRKRIKELEKLAEEERKLSDEERKVAEQQRSELEQELLKVKNENASLARVLEMNKIVLMLLVLGMGVSVGKIWFG